MTPGSTTLQGVGLHLTAAEVRYSVLVFDETERKTWVPIPNGPRFIPGTFDPPAREPDADEAPPLTD